MGINLCAATERIADVSNIAVGDVVIVRGARDEAGAIVPCENPRDELVVMGKMSDSVFGYEFSYRKGPDGYVTLEDSGNTHRDFVTGMMLINKSEYEEFTQSTDAREGPPAMRLRIYQNSDKLHAPVWVARNQAEVNYHLMMGAEEEVVVGGANAVHILTDGLFSTDVYVVAHGQHIYVLMGDFFDSASDVRRDFLALVDSFTFIPKQSQEVQGKINPRAACESALAYMTFESGGAADVFVEECVEGKHPEVIERYIKDTGLDGAVI